MLIHALQVYLDVFIHTLTHTLVNLFTKASEREECVAMAGRREGVSKQAVLQRGVCSLSLPLLTTVSYYTH